MSHNNLRFFETHLIVGFFIRSKMEKDLNKTFEDLADGIAERINSKVDQKSKSWDDREWTAITLGDWGTTKDLSKYMEQFSSWVYANVNAVANAVSAIEFKLYQYEGEDVEEVTDESPILETLYRVNNQMPKTDFIYTLQANLLLTGEAPIWVKMGGSEETELYPLNPVNLTPIIGRTADGTEMIIEYEYIVKDEKGGVKKITYKPEEIIYIKTYNPNNQWRGLGVVEAAVRSIDTMTQSELYNLNFFKNAAVPLSVLTTEQKLNDSTWRRLREAFDSRHRGGANAFKTAILEQGVELKTLQASQKDMDFLNQQTFLRDKLMTMFGTNKTALGITDDVNRANAEASIYIFSKNSTKPRMNRIVEYLNEFFVPLFDDTGSMFLSFEDPVKEDDEAITKKHALEVDRWKTKNEIRAEEDLPELEGGDEIWQPFNLAPMMSGGMPEEEPETPEETPDEETTEGDMEDNAEENVEEGKQIAWRRLRLKNPKEAYRKMKLKKFSDQITRLKHRNSRLKQLDRKFQEFAEKIATKFYMKKKQRLIKPPKYKDRTPANYKAPIPKDIKEAFWRNQIKTSDGYELEVKRKVRGLYEEQEKEVLRNIRNKGTKFLIRKPMKAAEKSASDYMFDKDKYVNASISLLLPVFESVIREQGTEALELLGTAGTYDVLEAARQYLNKNTTRLSKTMTKTSFNRVRKQLAIGLGKGEGTRELSKRVTNTYGRLYRYQADNIARTEVSRATGFATLDAYEQSGVVEGKQWVTALDERTCEWCAPLDGKIVELKKNYFKFGDTFRGDDGGTLNVDYTSIQHPPLHSQCYSKDTELLTVNEGWKPIKDVKKGESVWTLNPKTKNMEFGTVTETIKQKEDKAVSLSNKQHSFDMLVSENHPYFGYKRVDHEAKPRTIEPKFYDSIKDLPKEEFRFYTSSEWVGNSPTTIKLGNKDIKTEDYCKFMGYYLSEGSTSKRKPKGYQISIAQEKYLQEMYDDIVKMGFDKVCLGKDKIWIFDQSVAEDLLRHGKSFEKFVDERIKMLSPIYLRVFLDAFRMGDGSIKKAKNWKGGNFEDSITYFTSSKRLADDLGEMIIKSGKAVSYGFEKKKGIKQIFKNGTYTINHDIWIIRELTSKYKMLKNIQTKTIDYNDYVYDVEVDKNHTLLTRRNGRVIWGSNCRCIVIPVVLMKGITPFKVKRSQPKAKPKVIKPKKVKKEPTPPKKDNTKEEGEKLLKDIEKELNEPTNSRKKGATGKSEGKAPRVSKERSDTNKVKGNS